MKSTPPCFSKAGSQTPVGILPVSQPRSGQKRSLFVKHERNPRLGRHFVLIGAKPRLGT
jgi:hypothetical protein